MLTGEKMLCREVRSETEISREPRGTRKGHGQQQRCMYSVHLAVSQLRDLRHLWMVRPLFYVALRKNTLWYTINESLWSNSWYAERTPHGRVRGMKAKDRSRSHGQGQAKDSNRRDYLCYTSWDAKHHRRSLTQTP